MTTDSRADLYARSAHYALASLRNPELADVFTRRGIALAGDGWPQTYFRATGQTAPEPQADPKPKTRKGK